MTVESTWSDSDLVGLLGWRLLSEEPGLVRAEFDAKEEFRNPKGPIMGGILAAMLDMIISAAIRSSMHPNQRPVATLEMKINFIGAAKPGTLSAEGKLVHAGRSVAFGEGSLSAPDGSLIATGTATMRIHTE
jgi:uncharacterized protein (TIGR00369 family)